MRSGAAAGHTGYFHEAALYGSDEDFLSVVVPFVEGGRAAGEPTLVALDDSNANLLRSSLSAVDGITFVRAADQYARPASTIASYRKLFAEQLASGAHQIRAVGDVPHPGVRRSWDAWARYEAVINHAYDDFPLWGICTYDTRTTPDEVLADVERTHQHIATSDGHHHANEGYENPSDFLGRRPAPPPDPLEATVPVLEMVDPTVADARHAVAALQPMAGLEVGALDDLIIAVSEVVTNARRYGLPPVHVRAWAPPGRLMVKVTDGGPGIADPFAGLLPPVRDLGEGGYGLWMTHQLCTDVVMGRSVSGCSVRLVAGTSALT